MLIRKSSYAPWPFFEADEIEAVSRVLRTGKVNYWTGDEGRQFEKEYAEYVGSRHAVALSNGTVALELALQALGIGPGDEVVTTSRTFIASASCAVARGAIPIFADADPDSQNISMESIRRVTTPRTKAIIAVHLAGWPCEMDDILAFAEESGIKVIEDCAQAHGAVYKGRQVGSIGHVGTFSFCQDKIITTGGEGGMLVTDDDEVWEKVWAYKDHGKSYDAVYNRTHPPGFRWLHESFGTNGRMTEIQAAIGRLQLKKLPAWLHKRQSNARMLTEGLSTIPGIRTATPPSHISHAYYKYYAFVDPAALNGGWDRDRIMNAISAEGVPCFSGSCSEIYLEKAFQGTPSVPAQRLENARTLGETSMMFLVHPTLGKDEMLCTVETVSKVMKAATQS
jgi:dTDP-4-amino-4,6-dideoxygalactose transaminase